MLKKLLSVFIFVTTLNTSAHAADNWIYLGTKSTDEFHLNKTSVVGTYPYYFITVVATSATNYQTGTTYWKGQVYTKNLVNCLNNTFITTHKYVYNSSNILVTKNIYNINNTNWKSIDLDFSLVCTL